MSKKASSLTYWTLNKSHSSKYIIYLLLRLILWKTLNMHFVSLLLEDAVDTTFLQQSGLVLAKHR